MIADGFAIGFNPHEVRGMSWPDFMICIESYNDRHKDPGSLTEEDRNSFQRMFDDDNN